MSEQIVSIVTGGNAEIESLARMQPTIDCINDIEEDDHEEDDEDDNDNGDADVKLALDFEADRRSSLNVSNGSDMSEEFC